MQDILLFAQQHCALAAALISLLAAIAVIEWLRSKRGAQRISPALAVEMINHQGAVVIDIRSSDAFSAGHIIGAISMPLTEWTESDDKRKKLDTFKSRPIIITCGTGLESPRVVSLLLKKGFNHSVCFLAQGMRGWKEADMPLVKN